LSGMKASGERFVGLTHQFRACSGPRDMHTE
jgi:hypothetical protein